ncbi:MAG: hypothetical protein KDF64_00375 [Geminicoccaceae bacterium]|nr:hypothetical protein [Geminicoccaceae bacterium]
MRDLMLEQFLDFLEERHGSRTIHSVLDELGDMAGSASGSSRPGLGERGQQLRTAADFASMILRTGRPSLLRQFGGWLIDRHACGWMAEIHVGNDLSTLARRLASAVNEVIAATDAVRLGDSNPQAKKVMLVYRDEVGWADIVQGAMCTWLRIHAPDHGITGEDLSLVSGTHVHFCLSGPRGSSPEAGNGWQPPLPPDPDGRPGNLG